MYAAFFVYSLAGICSKLASRQVFLSVPYLLCFAGIVAVLGVYAVLWQQVLKKIPLSVAMSNKPVVLIFTTLWAVIFFGEALSIKFFIGIALVFAGLFVIGVEYE